MSEAVDGQELVHTLLAQIRGAVGAVAHEISSTVLPAVPWWGWALVAALLVSRVRVLATPWRRRDPERWFDAFERAAGRDRAGGRCEYTDRLAPWRRCTRPAQEADHFFPWARGGATTLGNMVAACTAHNQAKGGRMPAAITRWLITRRRRRYFPAGHLRTPGAWYRRGRR